MEQLDLITMISNLGFPISVSLYLFTRVEAGRIGCGKPSKGKCPNSIRVGLFLFL